MNPFNQGPTNQPPTNGGPSNVPPFTMPFQGQANRPQGTPASTRAPLIDPRSFTPAQWLVLGGGLVMLIGSLLPWYTVSITVKNQTQQTVYSGMDSSLGKAIFLIALLTLALFAVRTFKVQLPFALPASDQVIFFGLGLQALLLAVLYLFDNHHIVLYGVGQEVSASFGLFLALLAAIATATGGYLHAQPRRRP
jgi:hypothetical protein